MRSSLSTEQGEKIIVPPRALGLIKDTEGQGLRSNNYDSYYYRTGEEPVTPVSQKRSINISNKKKFSQIAISDEVNRLLRKASEKVAQLVEAEDLIEQANIAFVFKDCLEDLWRNRDNREDNWGDLLNILQIVLAQVELEQLSVTQKLSIKKVTNDYLCASEILDANMDEALGILSDSGFDPWSGISGKPEE
jgi:hypothetical protein